MADVKAKVEGDKIIITMPFNKKGTKSKSGKSMVVATTSGNIDIKVDGFNKSLKAGINVYFSAEDEE